MSLFNGPLKSSVNAGQLSSDLEYKIGLKQYYSGAKQMLGSEPVPQSGYRLHPGSARVDSIASTACRIGILKVQANLSYWLVFTVGQVKIYRNNRALVATVALPTITADILPNISFYGEANTFGIFHQDLVSLRLVRNSGNDALWTLSNWPYADIPKLDLGGTYTKTADVWKIYIHFTTAAPRISLAVKVDSNSTAAINLNIAPNSAATGNWNTFAASMQAAIAILPGMSNEVTVVYETGEAATGYAVFTVSFPGTLAGQEYGFDATILSTAEASALVSHTTIGETFGEDVVSASRGWFAGMAMLQDRATYYAPKVRAAAVGASRTGEYFDMDITAKDDAASFFKAIRTETSETILHLLEDKFLLVLTDQAEWFATNRTFSRNEAINFVRASKNGTRAGVMPQMLGGQIFYVGTDGSALFRLEYQDGIAPNYASTPASMLAHDLVKGIKRMCVQRKVGTNAAERLWMLRDDGRLLCAVIIDSQEITAFAEWASADSNPVIDIAVDGSENIIISVNRGSEVALEVMEEMEINLFQSSITGTTDLTGRASGLSTLNGKTVWARVGGRIFGPYLVAGGIVETGEPSAAFKIGLWRAPVFESMPYIKVLQDDNVVLRPGRIHSVLIHVENTESIAVGANGSKPKDQALMSPVDDVSSSVSYTGPIEVFGLAGMCEGPTLKITQTRPGTLRVVFYVPGVTL